MDFLDDNDTDNNTSSFPLFNFAALNDSFKGEFTKNLINEDDLKLLDLPVVKKQRTDIDTHVKRRGRRKSKKKLIDLDETKVTIRDILDNDQVGEPMESDVKTKNDKLRKMREGRARKMAEKQNPSIQIESIKKTNKADTINENITHSDLNIEAESKSSSQLIPFKQISIKNGKPILEMTPFPNQNDKGEVQIVRNDKPHRVTSMSFRPKNHTKQWTPEETRKFYKSIELFGADFSMIAKLFPTRNRKQVKNKLHREERTNPTRMEEAFNKHNLHTKNKIVSHVARMKRLEGGAPLTQQALLDNLAPMNLNNRHRSFSTCSLDSMDHRIVQDLKGILTQDIPNQIEFPLQILPSQKEDNLPLSENIAEERKELNLNETQVKLSTMKEESDNPTNLQTPELEEKIAEKKPTVTKTNLLINMLK